jgi:hypothetical protein
MPKALVEREIGNIGLTKLRVVSSLHARAQGPDVRPSEGFIALTGGNGSLEDLFEASPGRSSASTARSAAS